MGWLRGREKEEGREGGREGEASWAKKGEWMWVRVSEWDGQRERGGGVRDWMDWIGWMDDKEREKEI